MSLAYALCLKWRCDYIRKENECISLTSQFCSFSSCDDYWLKKLSLLASSYHSTRIQAKNAHVYYLCVCVLSFLLCAHFLPSSTSSSTARRTIDVTSQPINTENQSICLHIYIYILSISNNAHARTSEQGLSVFFPSLDAIVLHRDVNKERIIIHCSMNEIKLKE